MPTDKSRRFQAGSIFKFCYSKVLFPFYTNIVLFLIRLLAQFLTKNWTSVALFSSFILTIKQKKKLCIVGTWRNARNWCARCLGQPQARASVTKHWSISNPPSGPISDTKNWTTCRVALSPCLILTAKQKKNPSLLKFSATDRKLTKVACPIGLPACSGPVLKTSKLCQAILTSIVRFQSNVLCTDGSAKLPRQVSDTLRSGDLNWKLRKHWRKVMTKTRRYR